MSQSLNNLVASIIPVPALVAYLKNQGLPVPDSDQAIVNLVVRTSNVRTQANVAALMINLAEGKITSDELNDILGKAFPDSKAASGERHGKHYMSLARTGKLPGCNFVPAKENGPKAKSEDTKVAELEARVAELEGKIEAALKATSAKDIKKALTGE